MWEGSLYQITERCTGCGMCRLWCPVRAIVGRKKQRHLIRENCISCGVCGRVCGYGAIVDDSGEEVKKIPIRLWFKPQWDYSMCDCCGECIRACPARCIEYAFRGEEREKNPSLVRPSLCIGCQFCRHACNRGAIFPPEYNRE
ncbi:MAG: 4Fe-4S binding protein [Chloroflexota bacterium]